MIKLFEDTFEVIKEVYIPGEVPSSKNSKEIGRMWGTNRPILRDSKITTQYKENYTIVQSYKLHAKAFRELYDSLPKPVIIGMFFIRKTRTKFDYINMGQIILDMIKDQYGKVNNKRVLLERRWIPDDDCDCAVNIPLGYKVDDTNYGVNISFLKLKEYGEVSNTRSI